MTLRVLLWTHSGSELTAVLSSLQTLSELHSAHIAHLDVKGDNVMLTQNFNCTWDTLRLIDFAMAAKSSPGEPFFAQILPESMWASFESLAYLHTISLRLSAAPHSGWLFAEGASHDILPQGHAFGASAPELMAALVKVKAGLLDDTCRINVCAADMWSVGTVLYEMLTSHLAFNPAVPEDNIPPAQGRHEWADTVLKQTNALVSLASCSSRSCSVKLSASFEHCLLLQVCCCCT